MDVLSRMGHGASGKDGAVTSVHDTAPVAQIPGQGIVLSSVCEEEDPT